MKTATIDLLKKDLLIVELPRKSDVEIFPNSIEIYNQFTGQEETIKGSYTLLGSPNEIKEEDAKEVVHEVEGYNPVLKEFHKAYRLYNGRIIRATHTALESLLSALESKIYWNVNPISKQLGFIGNVSEIDKQIALQKQKRRFDEAQENTFDRNRTLIFVKN